MRLPALLTSIAALLLLPACGTTSNAANGEFAAPNSLMAGEIQGRIEQIPYQHREELVMNMQWLVQAGEQAIPALLQALKHDNAKVRSSCAWVLGMMRDRRVIPQLQAAVKDEAETVRLEVARSLILLGDLNYCPVLIEGLDSPRREVRFLSHEALKGVTGRDFGYDHLSEDAVSRHTAVLGWRQWWGDFSGDAWFATRYAQQHGLQAVQQQGQPAAPMGETRLQPELPPQPQPDAQPQPNGLPQPVVTPPNGGKPDGR